MERITYDELEKVKDLVDDRVSFEVTGLNNRMKEAVLEVERIIENKGLRCRIYTRGRIAAAGGSFFGGITGLAGIASAAGIAAHNLATFNPDYEIAKHLVDNKLTVTYKS
jgi:hypothetical protein